VLKLNSVGAFQWAGAFPSSLNVISGGIGAAPNGDLVISGQFASTIDADPGPGNVPLSPSSFGDVYIIRLQAGTTATPEIAAEHDGFVLYPNPADDRIITRSSEVLQNARLTVLDAMGHTVMAMPCSGLEAQLATTGLADGLYVLEVRTADRVLTSQRFVVRH
jgi:hypothetical protein